MKQDVSKQSWREFVWSLGLVEDADGNHGMPFLPWRLVGMGFLIAWLCCTHLWGTFMLSSKTFMYFSAASDGLNYGGICAFVVVGLYTGLIGPIGHRGAVSLAATFVTAAGTLVLPTLAVAMTPGPLASAVVVGLSALVAAGGAVLFLMWAEVFSKLDTSAMVLYGSASCLVAGVVSWLVSCLEFWPSCIAVALAPLISGLCCVASRAWQGSVDATGGEAVVSDESRRPKIPWKIVVLTAVAGFVSVFAGNLATTTNVDGAVHRIAATALLGAITLVLFLVGRGKVDLRLFAWSAFGLSIVTFFAVPLFGEGSGVFVSFMVKMSYVTFCMFSLMLLCVVCRRYSASTDLVFSCARGASEFAITIGFLAVPRLRMSGVLETISPQWLVTIVGLVALVICVILWFTERSVTSGWGAEGMDPTSGLGAEGERDVLARRCETVGESYALTQRECEILSMLAAGLEPDEIEHQLFVSHNTFKTHARHIYAKLGVHTREEAIAMCSGEVIR